MSVVSLACVLAATLPLAAAHGEAGTARVEQASLPGEFADTLVTSVSRPTALAFTPDGRLLVTTQPGHLRVFDAGGALLATALDLNPRMGSTCTDRERGLLGVAVDPAFAENKRIYLYYTSNQSGTCFNRVSRFVLPDSNLVDLATETVLVDKIPSVNGFHNGGDLQFGKNGYLHVSVGDGGCAYDNPSVCGPQNDASRDLNVLVGKVLRVTTDGAIPPGNPFVGDDSVRCSATGKTDSGKKCQETFSWGLRNPFRIAFDPNAAGTRFFINDVGQNEWEEIDEGQAGADFGWNLREGPCARGSTTDCGPPPAGMTNPVYWYGHDNTSEGGESCGSITGGAFVPNGVWPAEYDGDYLFADYVCGAIFRIEPAPGGGFNRSTFASGLGDNSAVAMTFGPHGASRALYYTTYEAGGSVRRIAYVGAGNRTPTASLTAAPASGPEPLTVELDGSGSSDPDPGDVLTYLWGFGDGQTAETAASKTTHTYAAPGTYTATLRVRDGAGATSDPATARIDVGTNTPPVATIVAPDPSLRFRVGQVVSLRGSATDSEDGPLPADRLTWTVTLHHGSHTHPFLPPTNGNDVTITAPAPEDLPAAETSYLEIELHATDSQGRTSATETQTLLPHIVYVTLASNPSGLRIDVNDTSVAGPTRLTSWEGYGLNVTAAAQTDASGQDWVFGSWSDGGAAAHRIETPGSDATYTATFVSPPRNLEQPAVSGVARDGETLTTTVGQWRGTQPIALAVQWRRCGADGSECASIPGAVEQTYALTPADVGATIRARVQATNVAGTSFRNSNPTAVVSGVPPTEIAAPAVVGLARDGETLAATEGFWSGTPPIAYSYQWRRCDGLGDNCADVAGATARSYRLTPADVGATLRARVRATNVAGAAETSSPATRVVVARPPTSAAPPVVSGTPREGETLTTTDGRWNGTPPITYRYQWRRCDASGANCTSILGATQRTYVLTAADVGATIRARVRASNTAGTAYRNSLPTAEVSPAVQLSGISYDPPGADNGTNGSLNGEWVAIRNAGDAPVSLTGWTIASSSGAVYRFGKFALAPAAVVRIHTGRGKVRRAHRYWGRSRYAWPNTRGRAALQRRGRVMVDICRYTRHRRNATRC